MCSRSDSKTVIFIGFYKGFGCALGHNQNVDFTKDFDGFRVGAFETAMRVLELL